MSYINFNNVSRRFQAGDGEVKALNQVAFSIDTGMLTIILGPSGSGKSTMLNLLGGMDRASEGEIIVGNKVISELSDKKLTVYRRHDVGFVFQFYNLIPSLTTYENVDLACKLSHSPYTAEEALEAVGLSHRSKNFPSQLSGGELQRVSIARALCKNPKVLLCDEPTGALDSETGKKVLILLQDMSRKYDKAVVIVTHNSAITLTGDRVIRLKDGRIESIEDNEKPMRMEEIIW